MCSKVKNVAQINEQELRAGLTGTKASWHEQYKDSAYIYVGKWSVLIRCFYY